MHEYEYDDMYSDDRAISGECIGMNDSGGKIMTQTKMETPERSNCDLKSDDRAREVTESKMSAKLAIFGKSNEWTGMDNVNIAIYERRVDDKAIPVVSQESEGQREQGQTEQFLIFDNTMSAEVEKCEVSDEWIGVNENIGKVMTQTKIEASQTMKCDNRAKCKEQSKPDWRSAVRLLTGVFGSERV